MKINKDMVVLIFQILISILGIIAALLTIPLFFRLHWPAAMLWFAKLFTSALSPFFALAGGLIFLAGLITSSLFITVLGIYVLIVFLVHYIRVTRPPEASIGFENAFGWGWESRIYMEQKKYFLPKRTSFRLPAVPHAQIEQNIAFATVPGTNRKLLCDVWQPPENIIRSGLAFIYLHGSAFYFLDKDFETRPFFAHLASQGHVIMDVGYRLSPETDIMGMINDVQRAIAWMKANAKTYMVDPNLIVLGGGSAGGHLALLTAYTSNDVRFRASDIEKKDLSVCAVISLYGSNDMKTLYYHTNQHLTTRDIPGKQKKRVPTRMPKWMIRKMGEDYHRLGMDKDFEKTGALAPLLGGHPDECPETYELYSVAPHVHAGCPPTLLVHGGQDIMAPVSSTRLLYKKLIDQGVQAVLHIIPQTEHGFDLILPKIAPSAHNAIFDVERFLAMQLKSFKKPETKTEKQVEYQLTY